MIKYVLIYSEEQIIINTSNITNYKPKDFVELLGVSVTKVAGRWNFCSNV